MLRSRAGEMEAEIFRRAQEIQEANRQLRAANDKLEKWSVEQIHDQRERLRVTLNSIDDAVVACDNDRRVTFLNPVAATLTRMVGGGGSRSTCR
jgi:two-component system, cell cycle sensor histidine kinase and response regulator CckA